MVIALAGLIVMLLFFVIHMNNRFHMTRKLADLSKSFASSEKLTEERSTPTYKDTLPFVFLGRWSGTTRVTFSSLDDVMEGELVQAKVRFFYQEAGLTGMMVVQPGWQLANHSIVRIDDNAVVITRTSRFISEVTSGTLTAVSRDNYKVTGKNRLLCCSRVQLYENGELQGFYRTVTELFRG